MSPRRRAESRLDSFRHAFSGWRHVLSSQPNARIHAFMTLLAVSLGVIVGLSRSEWVMLLLAAASVWLAEFFNTALEAAVDLASPEVQPLAAVAKDVGAAAVLIAAFTALLVGLLLLGPPLWSLLRPV